MRVTLDEAVDDAPLLMLIEPVGLVVSLVEEVVTLKVLEYPESPELL